ncbi:hypothetical protein CPC197_1600, partial [Chlamydia psittaci C1/97]
ERKKERRKREREGEKQRERKTREERKKEDRGKTDRKKGKARKQENKTARKHDRKIERDRKKKPESNKEREGGSGRGESLCFHYMRGESGKPPLNNKAGSGAAICEIRAEESTRVKDTKKDRETTAQREEQSGPARACLLKLSGQRGSGTEGGRASEARV